MHIKKLRLKNFKSHVDTDINFDQITSITGKNDSGKTNILRALKLLLHHGDWPATWIRYGQESASIELELTDGTVITRKRTKASQSVSIRTKDKIETYEGKKDATEFIAAAVGIKKIVLDETTGPEDLNFVEVHDGPYLLGGRADTVQRKIAGIVGANKIDDARSRILKKVRELESQLNAFNSEIGNLGSVIDNCRSSLKDVQDILQDAEDLNKQGTENETKLQILYNLSNHLISLTSLIPTNNVVEKITDSYRTIQNLWALFKANTAALQFATQLLNELESPLYSVENFERLKTQYLKIKDLNNKLLTLDNKISLQNKYLEIEAYISAQNKELETCSLELKQEKEKLQASLKELDICPMCNSKIK